MRVAEDKGKSCTDMGYFSTGLVLSSTFRSLSFSSMKVATTKKQRVDEVGVALAWKKK